MLPDHMTVGDSLASDTRNRFKDHFDIYPPIISEMPILPLFLDVEEKLRQKLESVLRALASKV